MKNIVLVLAIMLCFIGQTTLAQVYVGDSKQWIKIVLDGGSGSAKKTSVKSETDSSYTFLLRGNFHPEDLYFLFDKKNKCYYQKWTFSCDTCFHHMVHSILDKRRYHWKTFGNGEYLSKASKLLLLKVDEAKVCFTITQLYMRKQDYEARYNHTVN